MSTSAVSRFLITPRIVAPPGALSPPTVSTAHIQDVFSYRRMACALLFPIARRGDRSTMCRMRRGHGNAGPSHHHHDGALLRMRRVRGDAHDHTRRLHQHGLRLRGYDAAKQHHTLHVRQLNLLGFELRAQHAVVHAQRARNECSVFNDDGAGERELSAAQYHHPPGHDFDSVYDDLFEWDRSASSNGRHDRSVDGLLLPKWHGASSSDSHGNIYARLYYGGGLYERRLYDFAGRYRYWQYYSHLDDHILDHRCVGTV